MLRSIALLLLIFSCEARAADTGEFDDEPGAAEWFSRPKQHQCCDMSDGHRGVINRIGDNKYEAFILGQWRAVPQEAVIKDELSPFKTPVIWYRTSGGDDPTYVGIKCLILNIGL